MKKKKGLLRVGFERRGNKTGDKTEKRKKSTTTNSLGAHWGRKGSVMGPVHQGSTMKREEILIDQTQQILLKING